MDGTARILVDDWEGDWVDAACLDCSVVNDLEDRIAKALKEARLLGARELFRRTNERCEAIRTSTGPDNASFVHNQLRYCLEEMEQEAQ